MLEELIEDYLQARKNYERSVVQQLQSLMPVEEMRLKAAADNLLNFIARHSDTLISWERQHGVRLSILDDGS